MKTRSFFLAIAFLLTGLMHSALYSQNRGEGNYSFPFRATPIPDFRMGLTTNNFTKNTRFPAQVPATAFVHGKPYEAFFCKLEVKTEKILGFGFQIHAGDYNRSLRGENNW